MFLDVISNKDIVVKIFLVKGGLFWIVVSWCVELSYCFVIFCMFGKMLFFIDDIDKERNMFC